AVAQTRERGCDVVVGLGGGSVIDAAKAIAGLVPQPGDLHDYLEVVGRAQPLPRAALPWIAVPTTAGAGAEVTRNAVLTARAQHVKASLRSPRLLAHAALIDPQLTLDLPPAVTAATGLDALTQVIEPFLCLRANPVTDALCRDAIPRLARALPRVFENGHDLAARTDMALGALHGGLALANAGLGSVHGLAAPLGGTLSAPHGAVCAALLPHALELNHRLLPDTPAATVTRERFAEIGRLLTGSADASATDGIQWLLQLTRRLGIPPLRHYGLVPAHFPGLAQAALGASSMKANPVPLSEPQIIGLLQAAW
ncbi:MAG: iron-containing alcohol dehydrogenase, partial [Verrucomicrobiales bacterium]|nr:iron-containing alcohol dehydrogenase [Verrucomicrobiales bacterium]